MSKKSVEIRLIETISKESKRFNRVDSALGRTIEKLTNAGVNLKSTYSFPLKDTIGKTFREQTKFRNKL